MAVRSSTVCYVPMFLHPQAPTSWPSATPLYKLSSTPTSSPHSTGTCFPVPCFSLHHSHQTEQTLFPSTFLDPIPPSHSNSNSTSWLITQPKALSFSFKHFRYIRIWGYLLYESTLMQNINCTLSHMLPKCYSLLFMLLLLFSELNLSPGMLLTCPVRDSLTTRAQTPEEQDPGHKYLHVSFRPLHPAVPCAEYSSMRFVEWVNE